MPADAVRRPPGPRAPYPGAHLRAFARDPLGFLDGLRRAHGDVARFRMAGREMVLVSHLDVVRDLLVTEQRRFGRGYRYRTLKLLLGEGLLTSEGAFHLRQRRLAQPAFHRDRVAGYARAMVGAAERWDARWRPLAGTTVDVAEEMGALALAIVGETLFGRDVTRGPGGVADAVAQALDDALHAATPAFAALGRWAVHLPIPAARRFRRARAELDAVIYGLIAERRRTGGGDDLLSLLLEATDDEGDGAGARMTDLQLRDEAMTLFLAGHETTANALAWTWYLLATHPAVEARLLASLDEALGGRTPAFADVPRLGYARQVLHEALRLYPPAYALGRVALEEVTLGGFRIPAGAGVLASQWVTHRDPRWWPEPDRFDPDRWAPDAAAGRHRFAYFPFGAGTRVCVGEQFAWTEALLVLATLAPRWRLALAPGTRVAPQPIITLRPRGGIPMTLHPR
jgi:cytochrome P450